MTAATEPVGRFVCSSFSLLSFVSPSVLVLLRLVLLSR